MAGTREGARRRASLRTLWKDSGFRLFALSTGMSAFGNGIFAAVSFLYYTQVLGEAPTLAGAVLTGAGVLAILGSVPLGRFMDHSSPSVINGLLLAAQGVAVGALILDGGTGVFVAVAGGVALVSKLRLAARGALIAVAFTGESRLRVRAFMRSLSNIGIGFGSGAAAFVVSSDDRDRFRWALAVVAVLYVLSALPMWRLRVSVNRSTVRNNPSDATGVGALRDRRYVIVALLNGALGVHFLLIEIAVPIWLSQDPTRPLWLVSAGLIINTCIVAGVTVPLSPYVDSARRAVVAQVVAGVLIATSCCAIALAGVLATQMSIALALGAFVIYSFGEVVQATAAWQLSFDLADPNRSGEYQGVFASGSSVGPVIAPLLISALLTSTGNGGWLLLASLVLFLGLAHPLAARLPSY